MLPLKVNHIFALGSIRKTTQHTRTRHHTRTHDHSEARDESNHPMVKHGTKGAQARDIDFCGPTCEFCVAFDGLSAATQALDDSMEDGVLKDIQTFVKHSKQFADISLKVAQKSKAITHKVTIVQDIVNTARPALKGIPYIGALVQAIGISLGTLKTAVNRLADKEDELNGLVGNLTSLNETLSTKLPNGIWIANFVAGQANGTIHSVSTEGCDTCDLITIQTPKIDNPNIDIAIIDEIVAFINELLSKLSIDFNFPHFSIDLSFLDSIEEKIQEFVNLLEEVYDKVLADAKGEWQYQKCCEDVAGALATVGDFFSDLASLITCAADGASMGVITAALNPLLARFDPLLDDLNEPIQTYNQFATDLERELNSIKYLTISIPDTIVVFNGDSCSLEFSDWFVFNPLCGEAGCTIPTIDTFSLSDGSSFNAMGVLNAIAEQCSDAWDNVKDLEMDDCCGTARIAAGAPEDGWPHGHPCESSLKSRMCSTPHVCLENKCQTGRSGALCLIGRDCLNPYDCLVLEGVCTNGEIGEVCTIDGDCNSNICARGKCTNGATGNQCGNDDDCANQRCVDDVCRAGDPGDPCEKDSDCKNSRCVKDWCRSGNTGDPCEKDSDCHNSRCVKDWCRAGNNGDVCEKDSDCNSGRCDGTCKAKLGDCASCNESSDCISNKCLLRSTQMKCARSDGKMSNGCNCDINSHCHSGRCEGSWPPYKCHAKLSSGSSCNEDSDCQSNDCSFWGKCK